MTCELLKITQDFINDRAEQNYNLLILMILFIELSIITLSLIK